VPATTTKKSVPLKPSKPPVDDFEEDADMYDLGGAGGKVQAKVA
jgi:hypothetical protein